METTLLNLPWQIQFSLASGYAAYLVANTGNREHHQPVDVAFSTLLFGLFATLIYNTQLGWGIKGYPPIIAAFVGTLVVGGCVAQIWPPGLSCNYAPRRNIHVK